LWTKLLKFKLLHAAGGAKKFVMVTIWFAAIAMRGPNESIIYWKNWAKTFGSTVCGIAVVVSTTVVGADVVPSWAVKLKNQIYT
jgi:hypothetical protein